MARRIDENGFLEIEGNPLTKVGVFPYLGSEIGAPNPDEVYHVFRPADELERAADSFRLQPFINEHEWLGVNGTPAEKKGVLGVIGEQIVFDYPYLRGNVKIHSTIAQDLIDAGKIELSAGYKCRYEPEAGVFEGQPYQYVQRDIRCNHLALVREGRSGPDVAVLDRRSIITIDTKELLPMTIEELLAAIAKLSDEDKAKLLAGLTPAADEDKDEEDEAKAKAKDEEGDDVDAAAAAAASEAAEVAAEVLTEASEAAAEAAATGEAEAVAEAEAAIEQAEERIEEVKADLDKATMDSAKRQLKLARTALDSAKRLRTAQGQAMDAASVIKMLGERDALAKRLSAHVGVFDHSAMTIEQVAKYGCKSLGINAKAGHEVIALDAALQVRKADSEKQTVDSKPVNRGDVAAKLWKEKA